MKLLIILMTVGFAVFALPSSAQENAFILLPDTIETRSNLNCSPTEKIATKQRTGPGIVAGSDLMLSQKEKMKRPVIRNYTCSLHTDIIADKPGRCSRCGALLQRSVKDKNKVAGTRKYACTEHPAVSGIKGSECTQCGKVLKTTQISSSRHPHTSPVCINPGKSGKCMTCGTDLLRSSKEKMKMEVMNICCCDAQQSTNEPGHSWVATTYCCRRYPNTGANFFGIPDDSLTLIIQHFIINLLR